MPTNRLMRRPMQSQSIQMLEALESRRLLSSGLEAQYFDNDDFTGQSVTRTDPTIAFNWGHGSPSPQIGPDTFSARWQGKITAPQTRTYTIHLNVDADDGARLWIGGELLIDTWHTGGEASAAVHLVAGQPKGLLVEYREKTGSASIRMEWSASGLTRQVIPQSALSTLSQQGSAIRIMPVGDSITEGEMGRASYRFWLDRMLTGAGYQFDMVGNRSGVHHSWVGGPNVQPIYPWFDQNHQARWGATLDEIRNYLTPVADIALIHIGHNDIRGGKTPEQMIDDLSSYIDQLRGLNPNIKIILAQPVTNYSLGKVAEMDQYRAMIPGLAASKNTGRSPVIAVNQAAGFDPTKDVHTYDEVHPNEAGEKLIAGKFFDAIVSLVGQPDLSNTPPPPQFANLSGYVFSDANGNGVQDPGEDGLAGRFVFLDFNNNGVRDANEPVLATNQNGRYLFKSVPVGNYRVRHHLGHFATATEPSNSQHVVRLGMVNPTNAWNFGIQTTPVTPPPVAAGISGTVFFDINGNGNRNNNDNGIANRYVFIDSNNNGIFDANERFAITDASGAFTFTNLQAGSYTIRIHTGPAVRPTAPLSGTYVLNVTAGQSITNRDFGLTLV